jgi:Domain of unknown function (DUF4249)
VQKVHTNILFLAILVTFFGCERVLEYDLPGATPKLVVNALICEDSLLRVEVSMSASPGEGAKIVSIRDAKFSMFEDQTIVKDFQVDSMNASGLDPSGNSTASMSHTKIYFFKTGLSRGQSGRPYEIEVRYPGLDKVTATAEIPRPVRVTVIDQVLNESILVDGRPLDRLQFVIDDNGNVGNYYGLEILAVKPGSLEPPKKIIFFSGEKAFSENLVVSAGQHSQGVYYRPENGVYFSNGKFVGRKQQFEVYVDPAYLGSQYQLKVRVLTLSNSYFEFATSYQKQKLNAGNPFAEPTQVFSNIQGGLGIFAGYSVTEVNF